MLLRLMILNAIIVELGQFYAYANKIHVNFHDSIMQ